MSDAAENKKSTEEIQAPLRPSEITEENFHLADFDKMQVTLLCLVNNKSSFEMVSGFLKRRGWNVQVTTQLKELLTKVPTLKPDFVLISANVKHPKITSIPLVVTNTFKVTAVVFSEVNNATSMKAMSDMAGVPQIKGFASGPMIQRKLKQIIQQMFGAEEDLNANSNDKHESRNHDYNYSSGDGSYSEKNSNYTHIESGPSNSDESYNSSKSYGSVPGSDYRQGSGVDSKSSGGLNYIPSDNNNGGSDHRQSSNTLSGSNYQDISEPSKAKSSVTSASINSQKPQDYFAPQDENADKPQLTNHELSKDKSGSAIGSSQKDNELPEYKKTEPKESLVLNQNTNQDTESKSKNENIDRAKNKLEYKIIDNAGKNSASKKPELELVSKLISFAVDNIKTKKEYPKLSSEKHDKIGVITIKSELVEGLIVITIDNGDFKLLEDMCFDLKDLTNIQSQVLGKKVQLADPTVIYHSIIVTDLLELPEIQLISTAQVGEANVSISFLQKEYAWAVLNPLKKVNMSKVLLKQIPEDQPLDFNLYLYLEKNKKFFKINSKSGAFSKERKQRLISAEKNVYISSDEKSDFQHSLNKDVVKKTIKKSF